MNHRKKPLVPMGAITGKPGRDELRANLELYRRAGIEQFLIYPRSGLEVEYMGPEWLEICRHIIEYAAEYGMDLWLYDEFNWPSGRCRGKVIRQNPAFAAKKLVAFAERNFCGPEHSGASAAEYFWNVTEIPIFADVLNPAATDSFLELSHETYYRHFGRYFGTTIKGIFSDEPSFIYPLWHPAYGNALELPYYDGMKEKYRAATGCELIADLEEFLRGQGREGLWSDIYTLLGDRFRSAYLDRVRTWCDAHGILLTGHLLAEPEPAQAIAANGDLLTTLRSFSMPGLDEIPSHSRFDSIEWNTFKLLESAKGDKALAELFALGPSDMTLAKMRQMIWIAALHGVTHFITAVSALDARGNVEKPFYYNPIAPTQPWFPHIGVLNDSAAEAAELAYKPSTRAPIALRYPWREYCRRWSLSWRVHGRPELPVGYTELIRALIDAQWEFRLIAPLEEAVPSFQVVLNWTKTGVTDERGNSEFTTIAEILDYLERSLTRQAHLLDANAEPVKNVLLKSFDDGTVCVVNTSGQALQRVTFGDEPFDLPSRGVAVFPRTPRPTLSKVFDLALSPLSARLESRNSRRCLFNAEGEAQINTESGLEVRLALRDYAGRVEVSLDGQPVAATGKADDLPFGLSGLYRESEPLRLAPGVHTLKLTSRATDLPYLPMTLLYGNFSLGGDRVLKALPEAPATAAEFFAAYLAEYAGTVCFFGDFDLTGFDGVRFEHCGLAVELLADSRPLGARLWAPFEWELPEELRRPKVRLEVRVSTSVGPLFGDYPAHLPEEEKTRLLAWWPGQEEG